MERFVLYIVLIYGAKVLVCFWLKSIMLNYTNRSPNPSLLGMYHKQHSSESRNAGLKADRNIVEYSDSGRRSS